MQQAHTLRPRLQALPNPYPPPSWQNSSAQNQRKSSTMNPRAKQVTRLQTPLANATANESRLNNEIEALNTSLTHSLSSERELRAAARETREECERAERALLEENGALRRCVTDTQKSLANVSK